MTVLFLLANAAHAIDYKNQTLTPAKPQATKGTPAPAGPAAAAASAGPSKVLTGPENVVPQQAPVPVNPKPEWKDLSPKPILMPTPGGGPAAPMSYSSDGSCGDEVYVDCFDHTISLGGSVSDIDCGRNHATRNGVGKIGGVYPTVNTGTAVDIEMPGMGVGSGSNKMIHLAYPFDGTGRPGKRDNSQGCIHVNNQVYEALKHCAGTKLTIVGADGRRPPPRATAAPAETHTGK
jgi:hypothetical protein